MERELGEGEGWGGSQGRGEDIAAEKGHKGQ